MAQRQELLQVGQRGDLFLLGQPEEIGGLEQAGHLDNGGPLLAERAQIIGDLIDQGLLGGDEIIVTDAGFLAAARVPGHGGPKRLHLVGQNLRGV